MENLEQIKKAIEVEIKYQYINITGRTGSFSKFICSELKKEFKVSKNPKWRVLMEYFDRYSMFSMPDRKRAIEKLITVIKKSLETEEEKISNKKADLTLKSDVMYLKGVGPKVGYLLNKLGINTVSDLLYYFPRKYVDYSSRTRIKDLEEGETTTIFGTIRSTEAFTTKNNLGVVKVKISDGSGSINLNFFSAKPNKYALERTKSQFPKGSGIMVSGTVKLNTYDGMLTLDKPTYSIMEYEMADNSNLNLGRIVPIYPLSENLNIKSLRKIIYNALSIFKQDIKTVLPEYIVKKYDLMPKNEALEQIHFPDDNLKLEQARYTLAFEELFLLQLRFAQLRAINQKLIAGKALTTPSPDFVNKFITSLPFELTGAQKNAINEILNDYNKPYPMQRLLQGDVGSGKTVVACIFLLAAIEKGHQAAIMAPTEILAEQHYKNFKKWLEPLGIKVDLFLGSLSKKARVQAEEGIKSGDTKVAIGTHALIQDNIKFAKLGAIVVDEQHRFGVKQRLALRKKAAKPHMLTMTATPIPRTLAITLNGDLDLTIIDELPKGRKPIETSIVNSRRQIASLIRQEVEKGHQAYIVYPLIEESEALSAKAATEEKEKWEKEVFPEYKIGLLHGKLKNDEKDEVMRKFKDREYDILVSTTVVEVGVDVPNATVIVIENAERFGLSQLHQLRGRVGRSEMQSYCILTTSSHSPETRARLDIMTQTNDGFVIAEKDLQIRGPGEFLGTRQSGIPDMIIADVVNDAKILEQARAEAINFVKTKNIEDYPLLKDAKTLKFDGDFFSAG